MKLAERVHTYLREDPVSSFTLAPYDIMGLGASLARVDIHDFPEGVIQLLDVMKRGFKLDKEGTALLTSAHEKLDSVYLHVPVINPQHCTPILPVLRLTLRSLLRCLLSSRV